MKTRGEPPLDTNLDRERFCRLWSRCAAHGHHEAGDGKADAGAGAGADAVFAELAEYYREPHRHYHTGRHINDCLSRMDLAEAELGRSDGVELAIWFHDVIYVSGDPDNERLSADWFAEKAAGALPPEIIRTVEGYIMSTVHREMPTDEGAKFVVDVDLSGLGMSPQSFKRDGDNIRREFPDMSDAEFDRGQAGFFEKMLDRERIYATDFFYDLCEVPARININLALDDYAAACRRAAEGG